MHYNNGAVWPFVTGFVAWAQYNYRRPWAGLPLVDALKQMTFDWARGRHPELLSGRYYRPLDTAVPQQFFASSMLLSPIINGLLGWEPDAPRQRATLTPQFPPNWTRASATKLRVGGANVGLEITQEDGYLDATVSHSGPPVELELVLSLPPGAADIQRTDRHVSTPEQIEYIVGRHDVQVPIRLTLSGGTNRVSLSWSGGLGVVPPTMRLTPGQASNGVRVLDFGVSETGWSLVVEGEADRSYDIGLVGTHVTVSAGPATVLQAGGSRQLRVSLPSGPGRCTATVHLVRTPN
jgi:hypothetical protein